jgi:hypothetical protein
MPETNKPPLFDPDKANEWEIEIWWQKHYPTPDNRIIRRV